MDDLLDDFHEKETKKSKPHVYVKGIDFMAVVAIFKKNGIKHTVEEINSLNNENQLSQEDVSSNIFFSKDDQFVVKRILDDFYEKQHLESLGFKKNGTSPLKIIGYFFLILFIIYLLVFF